MAKKVPIELQLEKEKTSRELYQEALAGVRQTAVVLANSPVLQLIGGVVLIKLLGRWKIDEQLVIDKSLNDVMTGAVVAKGVLDTTGDIIEKLNPFD